MPKVKVKKLLPKQEGLGFRQFLLKALLFFAVFAVVSGAFHLAEHEIPDYALFFNPLFNSVFAAAIALFAFLLLIKEDFTAFKSYTFNKNHAIFFFLVSATFFALRLTLPVSGFRRYMTLIAAIALALAVFGWPFFKQLFRSHLKEAIASGLAFIVAYEVLQANYLLYFTTLSSFALLKASFPGIILSSAGRWPEFILPNFSAYVTSFCSGIESMTLFSLFFLAAVVLRYQKINRKKIVPFYFLGIAGAYLITVLRLWALFAIGEVFSAELAFGVFHSYASLVVYANYFIIFWILARERMSV